MTSPQPQTQQVQQPVPPKVEPQTEERHEEKRAGGKLVHLHTAHPQVPIPYVTPGDLFSNVRDVTSTATTLLPSPRKLAFYGLLGGMTVAGAMAWPVAVAVGAATEVITREQAARQREEHERIERERLTREQGAQPSAERTERTETGTPRQTTMG